MKSSKLNAIIESTNHGLWFIMVGVGMIIGKTGMVLAKKFVDLVFNLLVAKGAGVVSDRVGDKLIKKLDKQITKRLKPIEKRMQNIDHKIENQDIAEAGAFNLILEKLNERQNDK